MKKILLLLVLGLGIQTVNAQRELSDTAHGLYDHTNDVNVGEFSLDGRRYISGGLDRKVYFYDGTNWYQRYSYSHMDQITSVAISRDNAIIASASKDNVLKIYFLDSAKMLEFKQDAPITDIVFDFGMRMLYTASSDGNIRPYDLRKGTFVGRKFDVGSPITSLCISHRNFLYAGLKGGEIGVYNFLGKEITKFKAHDGDIMDLHFVFWKNKAYLASASEDKTVKVWNTKKRNKLLQTFSKHTWTVNDVEMSRDLKYIMSAGKDGFSYIWDLTSGELLIKIPSRGQASKSISINDDNSQVATVSVVRDPREYVVYIWDTGLAEKKPEKKENKAPKQKTKQ